jgi:acetate kinase
MKILVLNAGSSSQKSCLYDLEELPSKPIEPIWKADIDWHNQLLTTKTKQGKSITHPLTEDRLYGIKKMLETLWQGETAVLKDLTEVNIVGHRIVHGGDYTKSLLITSEVKERIRSLIPLSPNHNPAHLEGIKVIEGILGTAVPQIAVFDTAFHTSQSPEIATYPLPYELFEQGIRSYGFHGISHRYCASRSVELLNVPKQNLRLINAHLGNGCSLAAISEGKSIETTMGFTPLEGLMMGTRCGSIDPAIALYLIREKGLTCQQVDTMFNKSSGLLGVSGISADLRAVLAAIKEDNQRAKLAFTMYIHRVSSGIGSLIPVLGGLDALSFTAGVGENSSLVRAKVCEKLAFLGIELDLEKNETARGDQIISTSGSKIKVLIIHTEEDWLIAEDCWNFIHLSQE